MKFVNVPALIDGQKTETLVNLEAIAYYYTGPEGHIVLSMIGQEGKLHTNMAIEAFQHKVLTARSIQTD